MKTTSLKIHEMFNPNLKNNEFGKEFELVFENDKNDDDEESEDEDDSDDDKSEGK
jgi:hypothetical protein